MRDVLGGEEDEVGDLTELETDEGAVNQARGAPLMRNDKLSGIGRDDDKDVGARLVRVLPNAVADNGVLAPKKHYFAATVKNCSKDAYELRYGPERARALQAKFEEHLEKNEASLAEATDEDEQRKLHRVVWYYKGLVKGDHDWYALKAVYETHLRLNLIANDYTQATLWQCCCVPAFEQRLAGMLGPS